MARAITQSASLKVLRKNLKRASAFVEVFDAGDLRPAPGKRRGVGPPSGHERELLRAAVVMAIGALDAYLSDVAAEVLISQLERAAGMPNDGARNLLRRVLKEIDTLALELALVTDQAERRRIAQVAIADHLANRVSNHGAKGVVETLGRMGGNIDWSAIPVPAALSAASVATPAGVLDEWTRKRHQIVHQGTAVKVARDEARGVLDLADAVAANVDSTALALLRN